LLIEAAKLRGFGTNKEEILKKVISSKRELEQKAAAQSLNRQKKILIVGIILFAIGFIGRISIESDIFISDLFRDIIYLSDVTGKVLLVLWVALWFYKKRSQAKE